MLATFFVTTDADTIGGICTPDNLGGSINCSIRDAIAAAEATPEADRIEIPANTYTLNPLNGSLEVNLPREVAFVGTGVSPTDVVIDGADNLRVFALFGSGNAHAVSVENLTIQNGRAFDGGGGAIGAGSDVDLTLTNVIIQNNEAANGPGGGIEARGNLTIVDSAILNNTAASNGGGITFDADTGPRALTIRSSSISGNVTGNAGSFGYGGGVFVDEADADATIDNVTITGNTAGDSGGGIYVRNGQIDVINGSNFEDNRAVGTESGGGGLYVFGTDGSDAFSILGGTFEGNTAVQGAGGLETLEASGSVNGTTFRSNQVVGTGTGFDSGGGAIAAIALNPADAPTVTLDGILVEDNSAPAAGGIAGFNADLRISNSTVRNNRATLTAAGGIGVTSVTGNETLTITGTTISGNTAVLDAGGVGSAGVDVEITGGVVSSNVAQTGRAGGIGIQSAAGTVPQLDTSGGLEVTGNTANTDGGGLGVDNAIVLLVDTQFSGNQSTNGNGDGFAIASPGTFSLAQNVSDSDGIFVDVDSTLVSRDSSFASSLIAGAVNAESLIAPATTSFAGPLSIANTGVIQTDSRVSEESRLVIEDGSQLDNQGLIRVTTIDEFGPATLSVTNGPLVNGPNGTIEISSGQQFGDRTILGSIDNQGTIQVPDIAASIIGDIANTGTIEIGSMQTLSQTGDFNHLSSGILQVGVSGAAGVDSGRLSVSGNASLQGTLDLDLNANATFTAGDSLTLIDYAGFQNQFDSILGTDIGGGLTLVPTFDPAEFILTATANTPTRNLIVQDATVNESDGTVDLSVSIDGDVGSPFTVDFMTADVTALEPDDYTQQSGTLSFNGLASDVQTITIPIVDDAITELDETFEVTFSNALPDTIDVDVSAVATVTIVDDDVSTLTIGDASRFEDGGFILFDVTLLGAVDTPITVDASTIELPGQAIAGVDFVANSETLTFSGNDGETQSFGVTIITNLDPEPNRTFAVDLSNVVSNGRDVSIVPPGRGIGTIVDDDSDNVDLRVEVDPAETLPYSGGRTFDEIIVTNVSPNTATGVSVEITLDPRTTVDSVFTDNGSVTQNGNQVTVTFARIDPTLSEIIFVDTTVDSGLPNTQLTTSATATSNEVDSNPNDNTATAVVQVVPSHRLSTGTGDGDITLDVDPFGNFGVNIYSGAIADYDPIGSLGAAETVFLSSLAIRESTTGPRMLLDRPNDTEAASSAINGDLTQALSSFVLGSFDVDVTQTVAPMLDALGNRNGAQLQQAFTWTNNSAAPVTLDLTRYSDNDLLFDGSLLDGGGLLIDSNGDLVLFETDSGGNGADDVTFVGINDDGGSAPATERFMIDDFDQLRIRLENGDPLLDQVVGDDSGNGFIDPGNEYDVALALRRLFTIAPGQSVQYSTSTFFGRRPTAIVPPTPRTVQGHVYCDENGNGFEDPGEAVVGTTVFLDQDGNRRLDSGERSTVTDSAGDYLFDNVIDPTLTVVAVIPSGCLSIPDNPGIVRTTVPLSGLPRGLSATDVDGDDDLDLVVIGDLTNTLTTLINDQGNFDLGSEIPTVPRPLSVASMPNGTSPIIAVAGIGDPGERGRVVTYSGTSVVAETTLGDGPFAVAMDDFDGNGVLDVVYTSFRSSEAHLVLNNESQIEPLAVGNQLTEVVTGDVNDDGAADIAIGGFGYTEDFPSDLAIRLGDGIGGFSLPLFADVSPGLVDLAVSPLDRRSQDNVLFTLSGNRVSVYDVEGEVLEEVGGTDVSDGATSLAIGDFNRDGFADLAIASLGNQQIAFHIGNGLGEFALIATVNDVAAPSDLVTGDFDNDGDDDVAAASFYASTPDGFGAPGSLTILMVDIAESPIAVIGGSVAQVDFVFPNADPTIQFDVTGDGEVTPMDALRVINELAAINEPGAADRLGVMNDSEPADDRRSETDVNGDGSTTALDALLIINEMERLHAGFPQQVFSELGDDDEEDRLAAVDVVFRGF